MSLHFFISQNSQQWKSAIPILALAIVLLSLNGSDLDGDRSRNLASLCSRDYNPVCATNGYTYRNYCELSRVYNRILLRYGECPKIRFCVIPLIYAPVCGVDNKTYANRWSADCARMIIDYYGACAPAINCAAVLCSTTYNPACAKNGVTYKNRCILECSGNQQLAYEGVCPAKANCICTREYNPVCGVNGQTYANPCIAACANMSVDYPGQCRTTTSVCICPSAPYGTFPPVCGKDGKNYESSCQATCAKVETAYNGLCRLNCQVIRCNTSAYNPVCAQSGTTYKNQCVAECIESQQSKQAGPCPPKQGCVCTLQYDPVCGVNGKTYGNACALACDNMSLERRGEC